MDLWWHPVQLDEITILHKFYSCNNGTFIMMRCELLFSLHFSSFQNDKEFNMLSARARVAYAHSSNHKLIYWFINVTFVHVLMSRALNKLNESTSKGTRGICEWGRIIKKYLRAIFYTGHWLTLLSIQKNVFAFSCLKCFVSKSMHVNSLKPKTHSKQTIRMRNRGEKELKMQNLTNIITDISLSEHSDQHNGVPSFFFYLQILTNANPAPSRQYAVNCIGQKRR